MYLSISAPHCSGYRGIRSVGLALTQARRSTLDATKVFSPDGIGERTCLVDSVNPSTLRLGYLLAGSRENVGV